MQDYESILTRFVGRLGWPILITLCSIPMLIWLFMLPFGDRIGNSYVILTSIGRLSGIAAIVCYCFNLILTTRLKFVEDMFGGLNKSFIAHHLIGGFALIFALVHSTALILRLTSVSLSDAAHLAIPFTKDWATTFGVLGLWGFIILMVLTFYIKLPYRIWLLTHKFLGLVFLSIALHVILITSDLSQNIYLKTYLLILIGLASISYVYRTLLPRFFARRYKYSVASINQMSADMVRITMTPDNRVLDFKSGQFIFVSFRIDGFSREWHPFTISSNSAQQGISITVKGLGKYTSSLVKLSPGMVSSEVWIEGAYGKFSFRNFKAKRQIWIAGGIGITPFLSMLPEVRPDYKIDLYYSVKSEAELIDTTVMSQWMANSQGSLIIFPVVSDKTGLLSADKIIANSGDLSDCELLLCGPPPMMHALRDQFQAKGIKKHQIHSEEFALT